jgi:polyphosphate glucokinase
VVKTPYPCTPEALVNNLADLVAPLPVADRVSAGFPGMVRRGHILSAPHFSTEGGPGTRVDDDLVKAWDDFDLAAALRKRLGKPTKVANDADVQGAAVVSGKGFEVVVTLGTGVGTALFYDGRLLPHLEFAHTPFRKGETYNQQLGEYTRKEIGNTRWNKRVWRAVDTVRALTFFDHCYIGGGNSKHISGDIPPDVTIVDNTAGILGGITLWKPRHLSL